MAEQFGIDNLKKLVKFSCNFTKQISVALEDGKFQWIEAVGFVDEVMEIPGVVKSFPQIKQEIEELSIEERASLYNYLVEEFDIPNDKVEIFIENSIMFAISAVTLFEQFKLLKNPESPHN